MVVINNLRVSGVDFIVLLVNILYIVFDEFKKCLNILFVSIIEVICDEVKWCNIFKIGLIGIIFIMNGEFFKKLFLKNYIEVIILIDEEKDFVN